MLYMIFHMDHMVMMEFKSLELGLKHTEGGLLFSREMAVNESLSCDRNRFLVGISNLKKFGSFHVFFPVHMRNLIFSRDLKELFSRACDQKLIFE